MPDYTELRDQLHLARAGRVAATESLAAARAAVKTEVRRRAVVSRVTPPSTGHEAELDGIARVLDGELAQARDAHRAALAAEAAALAALEDWTDPTRHLNRLPDNVPILLMPVRVETRFKDVLVQNAVQHQLWVRVFPDDCWIDSFRPSLTPSEAANVRAYWISMWKAGGLPSLERAAWRTLVGAHGSGRAGWIVSQYQPANLADPRPGKTREEDVILVIVVDAALAASEQQAIVDFWKAMWRADGATAPTAAARAQLSQQVGAARAKEIERDLVPVNFADPIADGFTRAQLIVDVQPLVLGAAATQPGAWSRAPHVDALPERFVFVGYRANQDPLVVVGKHVPPTLTVAPDPSAPESEQLRHDADGHLIYPDELTWLADFDRAVSIGMGFRIPLTPMQARAGFDRVVVVGVRVTDGEATSQAVLETLLAHHAASRKGLALVPQGTPTNNTEATGSGLQRLDDPDQSFDDRRSPRFTIETDWRQKRDGQWLAEYLGVDPALFQQVHAADATDQRAARAINEALWPATLGYWMESMVSPVFSRAGIRQTREFFVRHVVGSGAIPALRIGTQPYGILPATAFSKMAWFVDPTEERFTHAGGGYLPRLFALLNAMRGDWAELAKQVSFVGRPAADPHQTLLDVVGLHSGSVEWSQRYAESLQTVFNRLNLRGFGGWIQEIILTFKRMAALRKLTALGGGRGIEPPVTKLLFSGSHQELRGGVVDDRPLSERDPLRAQTSGGKNYLRWLIDAVNTSFDVLYQQSGFVDDAPPRALLYLLLRHALQLGHHDTAVNMYEHAGVWDLPRALAARQDDPFVHVRADAVASESRYQPLYAIAEPVTGSTSMPVHRYITTQLQVLFEALDLRDQLAAIARLEAEPTARLERVFADHVDCCSYRLDAWLLGLVDVQLGMMRGFDAQEPARRGVHLGAYAWLEPVRPEHKDLTPYEIADREVAADFQDDEPLMRDSTNQGYVHAPSANHAVAAAVLRNGYLSAATEQNRQTLAVNLSSERVRIALGLLEGVRAGQGLADLLGYQFERGLHDRHALAEVDKFIYKLRKAFPLRADKLSETKTREGVSIQSIEARNVIDGLALVEQIRHSGQRTYPFDKPALPPASDDEAAAINAEAERLLDAHDAVADLALAEGVYQAVLGNYDRVASTYDAYAHGKFPPEPDVVRTPTVGVALTQRVALHLDVAVSGTTTPVTGIRMTPRAHGEPAINAWLAGVLPPPAQIGCMVSFREAATGNLRSREVTLDQLALQPADLLAIIHDGGARGMAELDERVVRRAIADFGPRPDVPITVAYMDKDAAPYSVFELMPLIGALRKLFARSRPLQATDLSLDSEARKGEDDHRLAHQDRLDRVRDAIKRLRGDADAAATAIEARLANPVTVIANVDTDLSTVVDLLERGALLAMAQAGWGFAYEFRQRVFAAILAQAAAVVVKWNQRLVEFGGILGEEAALPGTATAVQRFVILQKAERVLSTTSTTPLPPTPAGFRNTLTNTLQTAFENKRDQLAALAGTTRTSIAQLLSDVTAILPLSAFDDEPYSLQAHEDQIVAFAEDAVSVLRVIVRECDRREAIVATEYAAYAATVEAPARLHALEAAAKAMLGEDFVIVPEFTLDTARGDELANALAHGQSGKLFEHLTKPATPGAEPLEDFPLDTWLYGVARVRDKLRAWEQTVVLAGSLGRTEPALEALQLPFAPDDRWFGLELAADAKLDHNRMLYSACFARPFVKTSPQCGLLIDEWTETIPGSDVHTGIAFHHDRPNNEAPQAMLLVTPSQFRGEWSWSDLLAALDETMQLAKLRAVEPTHVDATPYAWFLPATIMASQVRQLTIAANLALNNKIVLKK